MGLGVVNKKQPITPVSKFQTMFGVDKRALAAFRVCIGLIGMYDIIERWPDIKAHYSDEGILPRSTVSEVFWNKSWFSFHMMIGSIEGIQILFLINILVCFLLTIGYRSRLNMFLHYLFVISLQARNNVVGHGGDVYLRVISFFGIFLPLGSVFSIDSAFKRPVLRLEKKKFVLTNFVTFSIICQVIFLYVFSYVHKTGDEWRVDYTASYYALQLDYFRTFLVDYIIEFPNALKLMTILVLYYEGFGSVLFFSPVFTAQIRALGAFGFTMLHIGFGAFMRLGIFSPTCATGTLIIYPTWFWDKLFNYLRTRERTDFKIYYNGRHGYNITALVSTFLLLPDVEISPTPIFSDQECCFIQTNNGLHNIFSPSGLIGNNNNVNNGNDINDGANQNDHINEQLNNWIITRDIKGNQYTGYKAMVSVCKVSPILWPLVSVLELPLVTLYGKKVLKLMERIIVFISDDILVLKPKSLTKEQQTQIQQIQNQKQQQLLQKRNELLNGTLLDSSNEDIIDNNNNNNNNNSEENNNEYALLKSEEENEINCNYQRKLIRNKRVKRMFKGLLFNVCAVMGIIFALGWNCNNVNCGIPVTLPQSINWLVFMTRMDQMWSMFSPRPPAQHWWYTFEGELDDGTLVELWNNQGLFTWIPNVEPYTREKPNPYPDCIGNHRWFKVYENLNSGGSFETIRMGLGKWICREYNTRHIEHERLHRFNIVFRNEQQHLNNTRSPLPDQILWQHICYNKPQN
ncbi:hypothetical protein DDB_G0271510 [Dictyostelium discoideum AX4]|uniref:HTTM-like domain-containing protein n=1 Tax=Dictyostelium discoideum TaxID=44689 RepID=Q86JJ1_DICDI|nr:hypothetical protein DDB_G0271510 [Dictyostelium discoideum AX4]EAL71619.1 hypothetical protein DDB_G0271510 [Dictyostelium discoideum AX4]|eukprot:XP_645548.1 hypothetical protein DDB_G0271510 [Dictyostelium discoideum AX4]